MDISRIINHDRILRLLQRQVEGFTATCTTRHGILVEDVSRAIANAEAKQHMRDNPCVVEVSGPPR